MKLSEWNELLFRKLVAETGSPGDPLYIYVDAEVLAEIGGFGDPDEALEDFKRAFEGYDFETAHREASRWKHGGFNGLPPFMTALAMTVLAVTLAPIGQSTMNVSRRQWELLGGDNRRNNRKSEPAYYDSVPMVWKIWNDFLESEVGKPYGTPTANPGSLSKQGWARSQSFIRSRDKQDIYSFFGDSAQELPEEESDGEGDALVSLLAKWLRKQGSSSRLARAAGNRGLKDELGGVLVAQRRFWTHEAKEHKRQVRRGPRGLEARLHWAAADGGLLSLIVPLEGIEGLIGTVITDFQDQTFEIDSPWPFAYLTSEEAEPESWFFDQIDSYKLSDTLTISWTPQPLYIFDRDRGGTDWIQTEEVSPDGEYRVLMAPGAPNPARVDNLLIGYDRGPVEDTNWLVVNDSTRLPGNALSQLFSVATRQRKPRNHKLAGGLPLNTARSEFLNGFEPDIQVKVDPSMSPLEVTLDGQDVSDRLTLTDAMGNGIISLRQETLDPGHHRVRVRLDDQINNSSFTSCSPAAPPLPASRTVRHRDDKIVRFSLLRSPDPSVIVIFEDSSAVTLQMSPELRYWLRILDEDHGLPAVESYFDSCWFDGLHPLPGENHERALVVASGGGTLPRFAFMRSIHRNSMLDSRRVKQYWNTPASDLIEIVGSEDQMLFLDDDAKREFALFRKRLSRGLGSQVGRGRRPSRRASQNKPVPTTKIRADIEAARNMANPYEDLLFWLTERGSEGLTISAAQEGFNWLCSQAGFTEVPQFKDVIRTLESLGHVFRQGNRIHSWPASANWLPDSEALVALSGQRSEDMVSLLRRGEGAPNDFQEAALHETDVQVFTQVQKLPSTGQIVPAGPSTIYLQLGGDSQSPESQAHRLGLEFFNPSLDELAGIPTLAERLTDESRGIILDRTSSKLDRFTPSARIPCGRWREAGRISDFADEDAFLRVRSRGTRYAWWDAESSTLTSCDWPTGLWGFHRDTATSELFGIEESKSRFAIRDHMWLPADLERFLVMRSGLLPRTGTDDKGNKWRVYTNVNLPIAEAISSKLGHPWGSAQKYAPVDLENLAFV